MSFFQWKEILGSLPTDVNLLAVSKGHPPSSIKELVDYGQVDFGESRVQEAIQKQEVLREYSLRWHFIGHLQSNKARVVVRSFDYIHSVDSLALAQRISRIAREESKIPKIMLQVKFREDPTKGGFLPDQLLNDWDEIFALDHLDLIGLMTMSPFHLPSKDRLVLFNECRLFANRLELPHCSMGMSLDWKEAVNAGSTWLRIGSGLFGARSSAVKRREEI